MVLLAMEAILIGECRGLETLSMILQVYTKGVHDLKLLALQAQKSLMAVVAALLAFVGVTVSIHLMQRERVVVELSVCQKVEEEVR